MTGNLIGEPFDKYVFDQIDNRQTLQGKGFKGNRSDTDIQLLNSSTSFLKLASGVDIFKPSPPVTKKEFTQSEDSLPETSVVPVGPLLDSETFENNISDFWAFPAERTEVNNANIEANKDKLKSLNEQIKVNNKLQAKAAKGKLKRLGFSNSEIKKFQNSNILAKNTVLFNGLSSLSNGVLNQRFGIEDGSNNVWNSTSAYGLGGNKFGKQPMPGLISAEIKCINRGSIRSATVKIKAFNQFQFDLLELLYMKLGFTMLLEWGHTMFIDNKTNQKKNMGSTLIENSFFSSQVQDQREVLDQINDLRQKYSGNYDGFFGRVTNFSWQFSLDGTYDITLELYTLGDVVESLTVNVPADKISQTFTTEEEGEEGKKTPKGYTVLDKWMDSYVASYGSNAVTKNGEYINIPTLNYAAQIVKKENVTGWGGEGKQLSKNYCTVKELLSKIVEYTIPLVVGRTTYPMADFGLDVNLNIVSCQPNQISFDLSTCFIKPEFLGIIATDINTPSYLTKDSVKDFFVLDVENGADLYYGQFLNVYLNFKFIKQQLRKNIDKNGDLTLYKFLVGICDGINSALGDVNKIQPIIKNENEIVFIDQVQPRGNKAILSKLIPSIPKVKEVPFELYGYNLNKSITKSNFVNNFSFESKLDASFATSLAIGSTAGKSNTSLTDGTAFSTWNAGLQDRFTPQIISPKVDINVADIEKEEEKITDKELEKYWKGDYDGVAGKDTETDWYNDIFKSEDTRSVRIGKFGGPLTRFTLSEFKEAYKKWLIQNPLLQTKEQFEASFKGSGYKELLAYAFGGETGSSITYLSSEGKYLAIDNSNFFSNLKQAFKNYIQKRDEKIFKLTNTSSQKDGFIPLSLSIDIKGLSGIKIYQKLPVVTRFLPSQFSYGSDNSLDFIIESVDHNISDNNWSTKLSTLSIPPSQPTSVKIIDDGIFSFLGINNDMPDVTNLTAYRAYVTSPDKPWSACFISYLSTSTGTTFKRGSAHRKYFTFYKQNSTIAGDGSVSTPLEVKAAPGGWRYFDPRQGTNSSSVDKDVINTQNNKRQIKWASKFNVDTVYNDNTAGFGDFGGVQVGDIIIYNRKQKGGSMNKQYYNKVQFGSTANKYSGATHSDIVVRIEGDMVYCIGGNVNNAVREKNRYRLVKDSIKIDGRSQGETTYTTQGALDPTFTGTNRYASHCFGAIRPPADKVAALVAKAVEQYNIWNTNGWKESDAASFSYTAAYYKAGRMSPPTDGGGVDYDNSSSNSSSGSGGVGPLLSNQNPEPTGSSDIPLFYELPTGG